MRIVRYGDHPEQFAELTRPDGDDPVPVAVIIHGGFWRAKWDLARKRWVAYEGSIERRKASLTQSARYLRQYIA